MDAQQSSDRESSRTNSKSHLSSPEVEAGDLVVPKRPEVVTIRHPNFTLSIFVCPDTSKRVDSVSIEILSKDGTSVGTFQTTSIIPETISRELKQFTTDLAWRNEEVLMLQSTVLVLMKQAGIEWSFSAPPPVPAVEDALFKFRPVTPPLDDFAYRPTLVDEHLTAAVTTEQGIERLTVKLSHHLGFMRCRIAGDNLPEQSREWKIKTQLPVTSEERDITADLLKKANELLVRLHLDGAEELLSRLQGGLFAAHAVPIHYNIAARLDRSLARGYIEEVDHSTELEHSRATVSLQVGIDAAAIRISPCPDEYSQTTSIVFRASDKYPELTGAQLHYIETVYKRLSSQNAGERHRGVQMVCSQSLIRESYLEGHKSGEQRSPGIDSIREMDLEFWGPQPDLVTLLGEPTLDEISSIPGIKISELPLDSAEQMANKLDGGRTIVATRFGGEPPPAQAHWFKRITCVLLNDGAIRVTLRNAIGGGYHAEIPSGRVDEVGGQASTVASLFHSFAYSTGDRWTEVLADIERRSGENESDLELRLSDPRYENIPPFEDRTGARMLTECVKLGAFVSASTPRESPIKCEIRYAGLGRAKVSLLQDSKSPALEFLLEDYQLREVAIARPKFNSEKEDKPMTTLLRCRADGLTLDSPSYREILDRAHDLAREMNTSAWYTARWREDFPRMLDPFMTTVLKHMRGVA